MFTLVCRGRAYLVTCQSVSLYVCLYMCMHVYVYVCMYVCMHVCIKVYERELMQLYKTPLARGGFGAVYKARYERTNGNLARNVSVIGISRSHASALCVYSTSTALAQPPPYTPPCRLKGCLVAVKKFLDVCEPGEWCCEDV